MRRPRKAVTWLLLELGVVAVGVLVALLVENWREDLADRQDEQVALIGLRGEFEANRSLLDRQLLVYEQREHAQQLILDASRSSSAPAPDSLERLLGWALRGGSADLATGVLTAVLASGQIAIIQDAELRHLLGQWPRLVANFAELEGKFNVLTEEHMVPWLRTRTSLPRNIGEFSIPGATRANDMEAVLGDPTFENLLREQLYWGSTIRQSVARLHEDMDHLQARIEDNIEN